MPYANLVKQREAQRLWAQKKAALKPKLGDVRGLLDRNEVTKLEKEADTWEACVASAKAFVSKRGNWIKVATYANRACVIRHGGDYRSKKFKEQEAQKTLRVFAREVGMEFKTLEGWSQAKRVVVDKLPKDLKIDYTACRIIIDKGIHQLPEAEMIATYRKYLQRRAPARSFYYVPRYLNGAHRILKLHNEHIAPSDRKQWSATLKACLKLLE